MEFSDSSGEADREMHWFSETCHVDIRSIWQPNDAMEHPLYMEPIGTSSGEIL